MFENRDPRKRLRRCEVEGRPAYFHRFVTEDQLLLQPQMMLRQEQLDETIRYAKETGVVPVGCTVKVLKNTFALVEEYDGSLRKVAPEVVRFTDHMSYDEGTEE